MSKHVKGSNFFLNCDQTSPVKPISESRGHLDKREGGGGGTDTNSFVLYCIVKALGFWDFFQAGIFASVGKARVFHSRKLICEIYVCLKILQQKYLDIKYVVLLICLLKTQHIFLKSN